MLEWAIVYAQLEQRENTSGNPEAERKEEQSLEVN
jgi:hypothetical protein